jgi:phosphate transport system substrate-binding protein
MHTKQDKPEKAAASLKFFDWAYSNGDAAAGSLDDVPMPAEVKTVIRKSWANIKDGSGKAIAIK